MNKKERDESRAAVEAEEKELQSLMDEAEREQRQAYMQKVRDALREQREQERMSRTAQATRTCNGTDICKRVLFFPGRCSCCRSGR